MPPFRTGLHKRKLTEQDTEASKNESSSIINDSSEVSDDLLHGDIDDADDATDSENESEENDSSEEEVEKVLFGEDADSTLEMKMILIVVTSLLGAESGPSLAHSSDESDKHIVKRNVQKNKKKVDKQANIKPASKSSIDILADKISESNLNILPVEQKDEYESGDTSDEEDRRNTVGNVPLWWYDEYPHVGYDLDGRPLLRPPRRDQIDDFLQKCEDPDFWRTVKDPSTGQDIRLSKEDLQLLVRLRQRQTPTDKEEYEPWVEWFSREVLATPLRAFPEHKRSFLPSRDEQRRVARLVHALKMGWTKTRRQLAQERKEAKLKKFYDLWGSGSEESVRGVQRHIPAPRRPPPSHAESYNPPPEYLLDGAELTIRPEELVPRLPAPRDLQPFPTQLALCMRGHAAAVRAVDVDPAGQYALSASDDGTLKVWELSTGRCLRTLAVGEVGEAGQVVEAVVRARWCPARGLSLAGAAAGRRLVLLNPGSDVGAHRVAARTDRLLATPPAHHDVASQYPYPYIPTITLLVPGGRGGGPAPGAAQPGQRRGRAPRGRAHRTACSPRRPRTTTSPVSTPTPTYQPLHYWCLAGAAAGRRLVLLNPGSDVGAHRVAARTDRLLATPPAHHDVASQYPYPYIPTITLLVPGGARRRAGAWCCSTRAATWARTAWPRAPTACSPRRPRTTTSPVSTPTPTPTYQPLHYWCPARGLSLAGAAAGRRLVLLNPGSDVGAHRVAARTDRLLATPPRTTTDVGAHRVTARTDRLLATPPAHHDVASQYPYTYPYIPTITLLVPGARAEPGGRGGGPAPGAAQPGSDVGAHRVAARTDRLLATPPAHHDVASQYPLPLHTNHYITGAWRARRRAGAWCCSTRAATWARTAWPRAPTACSPRRPRTTDVASQYPYTYPYIPTITLLVPGARAEPGGRGGGPAPGAAQPGQRRGRAPRGPRAPTACSPRRPRTTTSPVSTPTPTYQPLHYWCLAGRGGGAGAWCCSNPGSDVGAHPRGRAHRPTDRLLATPPAHHDVASQYPYPYIPTITLLVPGGRGGGPAPGAAQPGQRRGRAPRGRAHRPPARHAARAPRRRQSVPLPLHTNHYITGAWRARRRAGAWCCSTRAATWARTAWPRAPTACSPRRPRTTTSPVSTPTPTPTYQPLHYWCPARGLSLAGAAAGRRLVLLNPGSDVGAHRVAARTDRLLATPPAHHDVASQYPHTYPYIPTITLLVPGARAEPGGRGGGPAPGAAQPGQRRGRAPRDRAHRPPARHAARAPRRRQSVPLHLPLHTNHYITGAWRARRRAGAWCCSTRAATWARTAWPRAPTACSPRRPRTTTSPVSTPTPTPTYQPLHYWCLAGAAAGRRLVLLNPGSDVGAHRVAARTDRLLATPPAHHDVASQYPYPYPSTSLSNITLRWEPVAAAQWARGVRLVVRHCSDIVHMSWHARGDYLCTVTRAQGAAALVVHQLSRRRSQLPLRRSPGLLQAATFHPTRPHLIVATQRAVRIYDLAKQQMLRKLQPSAKWLSDVVLHPGGDNLLAVSYDGRCNWFDLELSARPYQTLRLHARAVRGAAFHPRYPLFATAGDDRHVVVCHGMVYNDLLQNPLLVPLKQLEGAPPRDGLSTLALCWHPAQPWLLAAGADGCVRLYS
ncbi:hypothetical protein ACJJTC_000187 [Scirpophaga incertulas]